MNDEDSSIDPKASHGAHFDEAMLYDFAKFLTPLALLAVGGVLTLTQTVDKAVAKPPVVAFVVGAIASAGICAVSAASKLAKVGLSKRKERVTSQQLLYAAPALLGVGAR